MGSRSADLLFIVDLFIPVWYFCLFLYLSSFPNLLICLYCFVYYIVFSLYLFFGFFIGMFI